MTIIRRAQFVADTRITTDLIAFVGNLPVIASSKAYHGTYSYAFATTGATGTAIPSTSAVRVGFWINHNGITGSSNDQMRLFVFGQGVNVTTSKLFVCVWDLSSGTLEFWRRTTAANVTSWLSLASVAIPASLSNTDVWTHVAMTYKAHASEGFATLYVNGVAVLTLTGDTRLSSIDTTPSPDVVEFDTSFTNVWVAGRTISGDATWTNFTYISHIYIDDIVGEADAIPPARSWLLTAVDAAGANAQWTPNTGTNVGAVDEVPHDSETTYNSALAADLKDTFNLPTPTIPADHAVVAVIVGAQARRLDSGVDSQLRLHIYDGTVYDDGADLTLPLAYGVPVWERFTTDPAGGAWAAADLAALQIGYESRGAFA